MSIREIARQAAQAVVNRAGGFTTEDVADAVATAVLQFAKNRIGTDYDPEFEINLMLAAFTPAEPPQPTFMGIPVELREDFPKDAIAFEQGGRFVGGITNLAPAEPPLGETFGPPILVCACPVTTVCPRCHCPILPAEPQTPEPTKKTLRDYAQHDWDCDAEGCHGHNDGTICTTECPVGGKSCTCGLDALLSGGAEPQTPEPATATGEQP